MSAAPALLCFDGSSESANAIERAAELLSSPGPAIVAHAWSGISSLMLNAPFAGPPSGALAEGSEMLDDADRERAEACAAEGASLACAAGFDARPEAVHEARNTWSALRELALRRRVGVVVVGARGRSGVASVLLGSVSSGLVHHAPAPVLVVPGTVDALGAGPVMFCTDGSDHAGRAIDSGRRLLGGSGVVISAWSPWADKVPHTMVVGAGGAVGMAREVDERIQERAVETAAEGAAAATAISGDCDSESIRHDSVAWRGLVREADRLEARAVVIGSRGLTGIARTLGSVSSAIVHHAGRPVLVVPPVEHDVTHQQR